MKKYNDLFESKVWLTEAKEKDPEFLGTLIFSWGKSDVYNLNHRYYPHKTFLAAVNALNTRIQASPVPGMVDHPVGGGGTLLSGVSHILNKVWIDKDKVAWAEAKILSTARGKDVLTIIKSNVKIGASLRGFGEVDSSGKVKPGLEVRAVDLVVDPSFGADATITQKNVYEAFTPESAETDSGEENNDPQGNKPEDLEKLEKEVMKPEIKKSEELKAEYPELTKALEDAAVEANKIDVEKLVTEKIEAAKEAWKKDMTADFEEKLTTVSTKIEKIFEIERKHVADLCEIEGFIEDETDEEKAEREKKESASDSKLGKKVADLETKNTDLEKKIKDKEDADEKAVEDEKNQKKVKEALDTELEKKENKPYKVMIEKQLIVEGKVLIEKEEAVEAAVKDAKKKLSEIFTDAKKAKIVEANLAEIGKVEDPEGTAEVDEEKKTQKAHFKESVVAGYRGTFKQWLKEKSERE
ncbi:hypothetical protein E3J84_03635 [Candidatus Aerophobetes bacterium]|uniref:Uncharacterized protein n=1 Tax=Aerophobetes bacterium TaxID=2030807 RepID=A0A523RYE2_UNCAE|nr:MAG: hypothetical protein E3J84_03635 [Candidatus Aerophobetes bacterium]